MEAVAPQTVEVVPERPWRLAWLTPGRCRFLLTLILLFGAISHYRYLTHDCPVDLSGDESHYWDWSRQLDWSYYSKPPLVALIIRASCALFGDTMPAVRYPAILLGVGTSLLTYWLTLRLFRSDRLALGAVLLNHTVPMFIAGSVMMTIDPPFFFCWAAATCFAAQALLHEKRWAWIGVGLAIGTGFLAKYTMLLWIPGLLVFAALDPSARKWLRTPWPWLAFAIAAVFSIPVIAWNMRHGWVSAHHVASDTGVEAGGFHPLNIFEFVGGQIGAMGPPLAVILIASIVYAAARWGRRDPHWREMRFLLWMGLPLLLIIGVWSVRTKIQVNWPAPAWFSLMILGAYFISTRLRSIASWRPWRGWFWASVALAVVCVPILHNTEILYPPVRKLGMFLGQENSKRWMRGKWDPTYRLRGWAELGRFASEQVRDLAPGAIVMCEKYDVTSQLAFYMEGQPKTYYVGSWFSDPGRRKRFCQHDLWPDRSLDRPELRGRDALYIGYGEPGSPGEAPADIVRAFERIEPASKLEIVRRGVSVETHTVWRCRGFKGMIRPIGNGSY